MPVTIAALVLRLARTTAAAVDVPAMLADVCRTVQAVTGARAVLATAGRSTAPGPTAFGGSDETADRFARLQRDARGGPLAAVIRSGRPLHTPDLTRIGPPELAAAAAEAGLTASFTVPLVAAGEPVGALQLLGDAGRPVGPELLEPVVAALDVLAARLIDADDHRRLVDEAAGATTDLPRSPGAPTESTTAVIRVDPAPGWPGDGGVGRRRGEPGRASGVPVGDPARAGGEPHESGRPVGGGHHEPGRSVADAGRGYEPGRPVGDAGRAGPAAHEAGRSAPDPGWAGPAAHEPGRSAPDAGRAGPAAHQPGRPAGDPARGGSGPHEPGPQGDPTRSPEPANGATRPGPPDQSGAEPRGGNPAAAQWNDAAADQPLAGRDEAIRAGMDLPGAARPDSPTERLPAAPNPPAPGGPAPRPSPVPRQPGPAEVRVPAPRYHEPGSTFFVPPGETSEPPTEASEPAVNGSAPGRRRRHGRGESEGA